MSYLKKIKEPMRNFFKEQDFHPKNIYDADVFLRNFLNYNKDRVFNITLKTPVKLNGKQITKFVLKKDDFIDVFCPLVWKQIGAVEKLHALIFAFDDIVNNNLIYKSNKPQLVFDVAMDNTGEQKMINNKPIVFISADFFVNTKAKPLEALATIVHELYHVKQNIISSRTKNQIRKNKSKNLTNKNIDDYNKALFAEYYGYIFNNCTDYAKQNNMVSHYRSCQLKYDQLEDVMYFDEIKNTEDWQELLDLFYLIETFEKGAYNKEINYIKAIDKYFADNYDDYKLEYDDINKNSLVLGLINNLNTKFGYNLKIEDIDEFVKINQLLINSPYVFEMLQEQDEQKKVYFNDYRTPHTSGFYSSITWWCLKKLMSIHKNKCVVEPIDQNYVDKLKQKYNNILDEYELIED